MTAALDLRHVRSAFPILASEINGKPLIYLDTAASAQKPVPVLDAVDRFARGSYANVKRSAHHLAEEATRAFEDARGVVARHLGCGDDEIIFTSGTTDAINKAARAVASTLASGDRIVVSAMEHHSNLVPWQQIAHDKGCVFAVVPFDAQYHLDMAALEGLLDDRTKVVAITHVSNVLGTLNDIAEIARIIRAKAPNAILVVDGAQAVPHLPVDVRALDCDLYAFSGHKVYGPTGIGVLYGKRALLARLEPPAWGGEMVDTVTFERTTWAAPPARFEPGTPNIMGAVGLAVALRWLEHLGWDAIRAHERDLVTYALERLTRIPGLRIIGPSTAQDRGAQVSFTLDGWHAHDLAEVLDASGIAVRAGHHCAQPLHASLGIDASVRASFAVHTARAEVDALVAALVAASAPAPLDRTSVFDGPLTPEQAVVRDDIIDHALHPRNRRRIDGVTPVLGKNPNCGDTVQVYLVLGQDGKVADLAFEGTGCAISQAAMSKLTKDLKGKDAPAVLALGLDHIGKLVGIEFGSRPVRARCAMLGLRATQEAVRQASTEGGE